MKYTLEIELGNAAMSTLSDIADALRRVAATLYGACDGQEITQETADMLVENRIRDTNGNTVGRWEIEE